MHLPKTVKYGAINDSMYYFRCNAKYLWKRIPLSVQSSNPELFSIWGVGQKMWKRDLPGTYQALAATVWTDPVADIMKSLEGTFLIHICFLVFLTTHLNN